MSFAFTSSLLNQSPLCACAITGVIRDKQTAKIEIFFIIAIITLFKNNVFKESIMAMGVEVSVRKDGYFAGKLLLAMPGMLDPRFENAVIFLCSHDAQGAMGLVINNQLPGMQFEHLLDELDMRSDILVDPTILQMPLMNGGPVDTGRGFLLHGSDFHHKETIAIDESIAISGTLDALKEIARGKGPQDKLIMFGYAGWSARQLDEEIQANSWLVSDPDPALIFKTNHSAKWQAAVETLGVDPALLVADGGQA